jgi:hypothetical protein
LFRLEAERKGFRHFLEVFDPNRPEAVDASKLPEFINDAIVRTLGGVTSKGRPLFLKMVYHGPKAMEELVRFDPHLIVGILGGSAGTTRDAFQLLHDAQKYGARVALFGRKINNAENQLAFVHFLRLIVDGRLGPVEAVKAYHAVLAKLGLKPNRVLDDDLKLTDQSMSYSGASRQAVVVQKPAGATEPPPARATAGAGANCACHSPAPAQNGTAGSCGCKKPLVTESHRGASRDHRPQPVALSPSSNGRPDFARMTPTERLAYHRERLGLGR